MLQISIAEICTCPHMQYNYLQHNSFQLIKIEVSCLIRTFFFTNKRMNKMADEYVAKRKLSDDEKDILINFFENNEHIWSSESQFRDK